jgi:sn-glycerol 3-phosphate transport system substrate-binding protein
MSPKRFFAILAVLTMVLTASTAQAATEIQWWHAMGGKLGEKVEEICKKFNNSQSAYAVKPVYKGNYTETMTSAIAAFRAKKQPHIVQVFEVGTASMMAAKGAIYPVHKLMADMGEPFDQDAYLQAVIGYYTTPDGKMLSMPFNSSTPVLYYNKTAFKKAGLDPNKPPKTWPELAAAAKKCMDAGVVKYGFSVGWQSWVLIENFSAWHNVPIGSKANGFAGIDTRFSIDSPLHIKHISTIAQWQKQGIFKYGGRRSESSPLFINGDAAMYMNSSASRAGILSGVKGNFEVGVSYLPYWPEAKGAPQNSIIGGATLWVLAGHDKSEYKAVAKFLSFMSSPEIQADWHQFTGYVPITNAAFELTQKQGYYDNNPGADIAIKQLNYKKPTANSKGLRFGNFVQTRDIFNEEMEAIWAGKKTAEAGLKDMVKRGNALLKKFEKVNK